MKFNERVGVLIGCFDHACDGHMMNPVADGVTAGVVVSREPRYDATRAVQRLQQRLWLGRWAIR